MRVLFDIGHPAHVHYFRNAIKILEHNGHKVLITARNKEITLDLLNKYKLPFISTGKNYSGVISKFYSIFRNDLKIFIQALKFKPHLFVSYFLPFPAHVGAILNKPVIGFTDTERATLNTALSKPFTDIFFTPECFQLNLGKKHFRFDGLMEMSYLRNEYFQPDVSILKELNVSEGEKYSIVRFVSWNAHHDYGESGFSGNSRIALVKKLSQFSRVFISSEGNLPDELKSYQIKIPPDRIHHAMACASLYIGESPTMTTEAALLGTPSICVSSWACDCGNFTELKKHNLIQCFLPKEESKAIDSAVEIINNEKSKDEWQRKKQAYLEKKVDVTKFLVWLIENYPQSGNEIKSNPEIINSFK